LPNLFEITERGSLMSHFTKIQTQLNCLRTIKKVMEELELEILKDRVLVRGFGNKQLHSELVVDTGTGIDIGFSRRKTGYEVIADWEFIERRSQLTQMSFMATLRRRYSYHKVLEEVSKAGFTVVEENREDGEGVTLRVRRWV